MHSSTPPSLEAQLARFAVDYPEQAPLAADFIRFLQHEPEGFRRENLAAHFTGSAWLMHADGRHALLLHHRKLDRWLQPGGHADGDVDLAAVALREASEETGLQDLQLLPGIFDLDRHWIPARGAEPGHWHYDVRYRVMAAAEAQLQGNEESLALRWFALQDLLADPGLDTSLRRMALRSQGLAGVPA